MFNQYQIMMAIHAELVQQYCAPKLIEGMTVEELSTFDRALLALGALLTRALTRVRQVRMPSTRRALVRDNLPTY